MDDHADGVRSLVEAVLAFPNLAAADRSEIQNVLLEVDDAVRIFGPETGDPAALKVYVERTDTLLQRVHRVTSKYAAQAS